MSGGVTGGLIVGAAVAGAATAANVYMSNKQARAQSSAMRQAQANAKKEQELHGQAVKWQNQNSADITSILMNNANSSLSGGSTLLTGPSGVSKDKVSLGGGGTLG